MDIQNMTDEQIKELEQQLEAEKRERSSREMEAAIAEVDEICTKYAIDERELRDALIARSRARASALSVTADGKERHTPMEAYEGMTTNELLELLGGVS